MVDFLFESFEIAAHGDDGIESEAAFGADGFDGFDHVVDGSAALGGGACHLSDFVFIDVVSVVAQDAFSDGGGAIAFLALIDHGDVGDPDIARVIFLDILFDFGFSGGA